MRTENGDCKGAVVVVDASGSKRTQNVLWNFCGDSPDGEESWVKVQREKKKKWSPKPKVEDEDG